MSVNELLRNINFPLRPRIRITSYCNRRCKYCFAQDYLSTPREDWEITLERMESILIKCKEEGIGRIAWQGGEPLLYSNLEKLVEMHRKYGIKVMLFTNALVDKHKVSLLNGVLDRVLINCNEPGTYTMEEWQILNSNIEEFKKILGANDVALVYMAVSNGHRCGGKRPLCGLGGQAMNTI